MKLIIYIVNIFLILLLSLFIVISINSSIALIIIFLALLNLEIVHYGDKILGVFER